MHISSSEVDGTPRAVFIEAEKINADTLPFDVLEKIFLYHVSSLPEQAPSLIPDFTTDVSDLVFHSAAITLSHVSHRWRSTSISIPGLWSTIYLKTAIQSPFQVIQMYLQRARTKPLSLIIRCHWWEGDKHVWSLLFTRSAQWKYVDFECPRISFLNSDRITPERLPLLESASFDMHLKDFSTELYQIVHGCPSLREVNYRTVAFNSIYQHAPFAQLTKIILPSLSIVNILLVLERCPNIEILELSKVFIVGNDGDSTANNSALLYSHRVILPKLRELSLTASIDPSPLFFKLTLPALQSIAIDYGPPQGQCTCGFKAFGRMLSRSGCRIKRFSVNFFAWQLVCPDILTSVLRAPEMQTCERLELMGIHHSEKIIAALLVPPATAAIGGAGNKSCWGFPRKTKPEIKTDYATTLESESEALLPLVREMKLRCGFMMEEREGRSIVGIGEMIASRTRFGNQPSRIGGRLKKVELMIEARTLEKEMSALRALANKSVERDLTLIVSGVEIAIPVEAAGRYFMSPSMTFLPSVFPVSFL